MRGVTTLRPLLAAALALSLTVLAACGGSEDDASETTDETSASATEPAAEPDGAEEPDGTDEASSDDDEPPIPLIPGDPCESEVTITGAVEAAWSGEAAVLLVDGDNGPPATYQSADGQQVVTVYGEGNGFEQSVVLTSGTDSFGTTVGAPGIEVAGDGSGAMVDADLVTPGSGEDGVHVTATFTC